MNSVKKARFTVLNDSGFTVVEVLLVALALVTIGFAGYFVAQHTASKSPKTNTKAQSTDPYAGWATAELKYENISFKYPVTWKLDNQSTATTENGQNGSGIINGVRVSCAYPGGDSATITAPNGLGVELRANDNGLDCSTYPPKEQISSMPITTLGGTYYLSFVNQNNCHGSCKSDQVTSACLSTSSKNLSVPVTKNIKEDSGWSAVPPNLFCVQTTVNPGGSNSYKAESVSSLKANSSFNDAVLIFKSLHY